MKHKLTPAPGLAKDRFRTSITATNAAPDRACELRPVLSKGQDNLMAHPAVDAAGIGRGRQCEGARKDRKFAWDNVGDVQTAASGHQRK
jgi:hypothetical protein